jgi:limonene-1,2-epoxide hydrolase
VVAQAPVGDNAGMHTAPSIDRRTFLAAGAGVAVLAVSARGAAPAERTATEQANLKTVTDFVAAWNAHDAARIASLLAEDVVYRMTETAEPLKGREAAMARIRTFVDRIDRFDVLDTFVRGPMVVNERIDYFTGGPLKAWRGVGVFFLKDGKIVEWFDYTISTERA